MNFASDHPYAPSRRRIFFWVGWACLVGGGIIGLKPAYRVVKSWRATWFAREAGQLIEKQQWQPAFEKAAVAYQLDPGNINSLRAIGRIYSIARPEEALPFWISVLTRPQATPSDGYELIRAALRVNNLDFAGKEVEKLLRRWPGDPGILEAAAECHARMGHREAAIGCARLACDAKAAKSSARLLLARLLVSSANPPEAAEGRERLWQLAAARETVSLRAVETLAHLTDLGRAELERLIGWLSHPSQQEGRGKLLLEELQIRLDPRTRAQRLTALVERSRSVKPEEAMEIGAWLNRQREFARTLDLISRESAMRRQELFLLRLDALAGLARWKEVADVLESNKTPLEPFLVELYAWRADHELQEPWKAKAHWGRLRSVAAEQPAKLLYAAQYARKIGARQEARTAYEQLAGNPATARTACVALVQMSEEEGDTAELRRVMEKVVRLYPNDAAAKNDLIYLDLLLGRNLSRSKTLAQEQMSRHPELLSHRTTLALACLRADDPVGARLLYQGLVVDWDKVLPGWRAVHVAVLGASGETRTAREIARGIDRPRLKREERALVAPYLD